MKFCDEFFVTFEFPFLIVAEVLAFELAFLLIAIVALVLLCLKTFCSSSFFVSFA